MACICLAALFFVIGLLFCLTVAYQKNIQRWEYRPDKDKEEFNVHILWNIKKSSSVACGSICSEYNDCLSFTWNANLFLCKGFTRIFYSTAPMTVTENIYYVRKGEHCTSKGYTDSPPLPVVPICFRYYSTELNVPSSTAVCEGSTGHLLRIRTTETVEWFATYLKAISASNDVTIDGNDTAKKLNWRYSDGTALTYLRWAPFEPSSITCGCEERCLALQDNFFGPYFKGFNNMQCSEFRPFICQLPIYA